MLIGSDVDGGGKFVRIPSSESIFAAKGKF
jgi:hypothetical protein